MTRKLYYEDVYMKAFDARVTECRKEKKGFAVFLDQSAFFPEGGGQSGDRGYLAAQKSPDSDRMITRVLDTQEEGDRIYVLCDQEVEEGSRVHGVLDWQFRFDRMQNHSGEHIVSGIIHSRYGYQNVGFHMSPDRMTIDLSGEIPDQDLAEIERAANQVVWRNEEIRTDVYTEEEAEKVEFRSKKELHGQIRVVTIPGADVCACCGTHVHRTGEIGPIRIISHERFKGGIRMELMCGRWAYEYMSSVFAQNHQVSALVSARPLETAKAVQKVLDDLADMKYQALQRRYAEIDRAAEKLAGKGPVLIFAEGYSPELVQKTTARVMETCGGVCLTLSGTDEGGYFFTIGQKDGDLRSFVKDMNAKLNGKGGGRPYFQQGSLKAKRAEIVDFLTQREKTLTVADV